MPAISAIFRAKHRLLRRALLTLFTQLCLGWFLPAQLWAGELGAFFTRVNAYLYVDAPEQGKRFLVRPRQALPVLDLRNDSQERLWLYVVDAKRRLKHSGEGWILLTSSELLSAGKNKVRVYAHPFDNQGDAASVVSVTAAHMKLLNVTRSSRVLSQLVWQKVRYNTTSPLRAWILATTGMFRPHKSVDFLRRVYAELISRNLKKKKLRRLLAGVVRVGDSSWEVERALGPPLRQQGAETGSKGAVSWEYPQFTVRFSGGVVNQIN